MSNILPIAAIASFAAMILNTASFVTSQWMVEIDNNKSAGLLRYCFNGKCTNYSAVEIPTAQYVSIAFALTAAICSASIFVRILREGSVENTSDKDTKIFYKIICFAFIALGLFNCSTMTAFAFAKRYQFYGYSFHLILISALISFTTALLVALKRSFFNND